MARHEGKAGESTSPVFFRTDTPKQSGGRADSERSIDHEWDSGLLDFLSGIVILPRY